MKNASDETVLKILSLPDFDKRQALSWYRSKKTSALAAQKIEEMIPDLAQSLPVNFYDKNYTSRYEDYIITDKNFIEIDKNTKLDQLKIKVMATLLPPKYKKIILRQPVSSPNYQIFNFDSTTKIALHFITKKLDKKGAKGWELFVAMLPTWDQDLESLLDTVQTLLV